MLSTEKLRTVSSFGDSFQKWLALTAKISSESLTWQAAESFPNTTVLMHRNECDAWQSKLAAALSLPPPRANNTDRNGGLRMLADTEAKAWSETSTRPGPGASIARLRNRTRPESPS